MQRIAFDVFLAALATASMAAQSVAPPRAPSAANPVTADPLDAILEYRLDAEGAVRLAPKGTEGPVEELPRAMDEKFETFFMNGGPMAFLTMALGGCGGDVVSTADHERILDRLGRGSTRSILQLLALRPSERTEQLLQVLAIHTAAQRGLKPAIGLLEPLSKDPDVHQLTRQAATNALATLRGQVGRPTPRLRPLAEALSGVPAAAQIVVKVDCYRLPKAKLLRWGRLIGVQFLAKEWAEFGAAKEPELWGSRVRMAEGPAVAPYEFARRFGNQRVDRVIWSSPAPAISVAYGCQAEGSFDVEGLKRATALRKPAAWFAADNWLELWLTRKPTATLDDRAEALAARIQSFDAPIVALLTTGTLGDYVPAEVGPWEALQGVAISPPDERGTAGLRLRAMDPESAKEIAAVVRKIPAQALERLRELEDPIVESVRAALLKVEVEVAEREIRVRLPLANLNLDEALPRILPALKF